VNRLSKQQESARDALAARMDAAGEALAQAVARYNEATAALYVAVEAATEQANAVLEDARVYAEAVADEIEQAIEEKSERWQESEAGDNYRAWLDEWRGVGLDDVEADAPAELDAPDCPEGQSLLDLPGEP
jgi:hypothetical protein